LLLAVGLSLYDASGEGWAWKPVVVVVIAALGVLALLLSEFKKRTEARTIKAIDLPILEVLTQLGDSRHTAKELLSHGPFKLKLNIDHPEELDVLLDGLRLRGHTTSEHSGGRGLVWWITEGGREYLNKLQASASR
jgi:hypothetical protein